MPHVGDLLLGRLRVVASLGAGGAGEVFEVEHTITGQRRALKVLHPSLATSAEAVARMVREAKVATMIRSPRVAEVVDAGRLDDGSVFVLQELLSGETARARLEREGPLDQRTAAEIARQAAEGLAAAHDAGLLHRDVKPENLFISTDERGRAAVKLLDFGLTKPLVTSDLLASLTPDGKALGTVRYLAPEVEQGWSTRADVYSLGVTLYELLAGAPPYDGPTSAAVLLLAHRAAPVPLASRRPGVDPALAAIATRAMSADPEQRHPSARALAGELAAWCIDRDAATGTLASVPTLARGYDVRRRLGRGATSVVLAAVQRRTGRDVALKLLEARHRGDDDVRARFLREAKLLAAIDAPEVAGVLDAGVCDESGVPFLVLELAPGEDVGELLRTSGPLCPDDARTVIEDVARGLEAAHAAGVLHRDLKPGNLRADRDADGALRAKIVDFGIGKRFGDDAERTAGGLGTPAYMAPEQLDPSAELGPATDLYALGQVAYALLVGEPYFQRELDAGPMALVAALSRPERAPASARAAAAGVRLPPGFDAWFETATHPSPRERFASARALSEALARVLSASGTTRTVSLGPRGSRERGGARAVGALVVAAALAAGAWVATRGPRSDAASGGRGPDAPQRAPATGERAPESSATPTSPSAETAAAPSSSAAAQPGGSAAAQPGGSAPARVVPRAPSRPVARPAAREESLY